LFLLLAVFGAVVFFLKRHVRRQNENAPADSLRTQRQQTLHRLSGAFAVTPLLIALWLRFEMVWAVAATVVAFSAVMLVLRFLGFSVFVRLLALPLAGVLSVLAGGLSSSWPSIQLPQSAELLPLSLIAAMFCISWTLSIYSIPIGHGERSTERRE
jgi:hypothetical protein